VRKVFTSNQLDILIFFIYEIVKIIGISVLITLPLAWGLVNKWLMNFAYRIDTLVWMFYLALGITTIIAISSTLYITWKSSLINPHEALRTE